MTDQPHWPELVDTHAHLSDEQFSADAGEVIVGAATAGVGAIINVASTRALQSEPETEAYAASKGGLVGLTHALAMSLGPRVRVNCISPGWIAKSTLSRKDHAQHPAGRAGRPEDIGELIAFLISDAAGFINGGARL